MAVAWRRLFGEEMRVPIMFHVGMVNGAQVAVRLYPRGRVTVGNYQIRTRPSSRGVLELGSSIDENRSRIDRAALRWIEKSA